MIDIFPTTPIVANITTATLSSKAAFLPVLEEPKSPETASVLIRGFTWFKFIIQAFPDIQKTTICRDSNIGHDLIDQEWLNQFEYMIKQ